jgi:purine catabolism regulator
MEITLADLLTLETRLSVGQESAPDPDASPRPEDVSVSWAVTARTTLPHLPLLRGGELLLLPPRATAVIGDDLPALLREGVRRGVSGIVFAHDDPAAVTTHLGASDVRFLRWDGELTSDTETDINRLLTECRGNLYRIGTELERQMADVAASQSGLDALARVVSDVTGLSMTVVDVHGRQLAAAPEHRLASHLESGGETIDDQLRGAVTRTLSRGASLILTSEEPEQRIVARFLSDRIATAANSALFRDDAARPRGSQRTEATARLLTGGELSAGDQRARALALGLDPDAVFFVAISDINTESDMARALAPLGTAYPAGEDNGQRVALIAAKRTMAAEQLAGRVRDVTVHWAREAGASRRVLALSGPAVGVANLPRAAMEAEFVAAMQAAGDVVGRAASFGSVDDLGEMVLLYQLRDSSELRRFVAEVLGDLPAGDQRGTLRATLRAYLESGGSQVDASQRLGIHRNTLSYRLRRIGDLVGRDLGDPRTWLTLHLALRASDMFEMLPDDRR